MNLPRKYEESLSDTLTSDSPSEDERSGHSGNNEQRSGTREIISHQPGIMVARHHKDSSLYKSSNEKSSDLAGKTNEIFGDGCCPYSNTEPTNPTCFLARPDMNKQQITLIAINDWKYSPSSIYKTCRLRPIRPTSS